MKQKILDIISQHPKHYTRLIKKDPVLHEWVITNSMIRTDKYVEMIYSALYQESNLCPNNRVKTIARFSEGFKFCGHASVCKCSADNLKVSVSLAKQNIAAEQKRKSNKQRAKTMMEKYGAAHNLQRAEIISKLKKPKISPEIHIKLNDKEWLNTEYNTKQRSLVDIAQELQVYYGTVGWYCSKHGFNIRKRSSYSLVETQIINFLTTELNLSVEHSNWDILENKEIDIYVPEHKIGIEVNGLYWHSYHPTQSKEENANRHLEKTVEAGKKGITLLHITDHEWNNKQNLIKSMLRSKFNQSARIYARKCVIQPVTSTEEKIFLSQNHIQGYVPSNIAYGLYFEGKLRMICTFGKSRYEKSYDFELIRMCSDQNVTVVGGLSKLLKHFRQNHHGSILTYCDRNMSTGNGYWNVGFTLLRETSPGYFWTNGTEVISRYKSQKKQLSKWLPGYNEKLPESENMFNAGFKRFHNCGNFIFVV